MQQKIRNALALAAFTPLVAFAEDTAITTGVTSLLTGINFGAVTAAIFSIGVLVIGVDLAQIAYFKVRHIIKGSK
jgi:hypothetical protein